MAHVSKHKTATASLVLRFSSDARQTNSGVEAETAKDLGHSFPFSPSRQPQVEFLLCSFHSSLIVAAIEREQVRSKLCRVEATAFGVGGQVIMRMNAQRIHTLELQSPMRVANHVTQLLVIRNGGSLTRLQRIRKLMSVMRLKQSVS